MTGTRGKSTAPGGQRHSKKEKMRHKERVDNSPGPDNQTAPKKPKHHALPSEAEVSRSGKRKSRPKRLANGVLA